MLPMAGRGSRFQDCGYSKPKPLIDVYGKPMFLRVVENLNSVQIEKKIFLLIKNFTMQKTDAKNNIVFALAAA